MGGGIYNSGTLTLRNSTVSGNKLIPFIDGFGAGIFNSGTMLIDNSTISGNYIDGFEGFAGGILNQGMLQIRFSTVTNNYFLGFCGYGSGIANGGNLILHDTIVAGNPAGCNGSDLLGSYTGDHNLVGGNPRLGPLAYNGGHTQTHALLPGSPAIDAGDNTGAPPYDQRGPGFPRIVNGTIDIGAYEVQARRASPPLPSWVPIAPLPDAPTGGYPMAPGNALDG